MTNLLKNYPSFHVYLAGPIDFLDDRGVGFRTELRKKLIDIGLEPYMILDPTAKPVDGLKYKDFDTEKDYYYNLRRHGQWDDLEKLCQLTMHVDLRLVDKSDVIIAVLNPNIPMFGTIHEIVAARQQKKPVLIVDPRGREGTSIWAIGLVGYKRIFKTLDEAVEYLKDIIHGNMEADLSEWLFLHFESKDA
jgi:nucleoside 2-deoxyribosyltransferase